MARKRRFLPPMAMLERRHGAAGFWLRYARLSGLVLQV